MRFDRVASSFIAHEVGAIVCEGSRETASKLAGALPRTLHIAKLKQLDLYVVGSLERTGILEQLPRSLLQNTKNGIIDSIYSVQRSKDTYISWVAMM